KQQNMGFNTQIVSLTDRVSCLFNFVWRRRVIPFNSIGHCQASVRVESKLSNCIMTVIIVNEEIEICCSMCPFFIIPQNLPPPFTQCFPSKPFYIVGMNNQLNGTEPFQKNTKPSIIRMLQQDIIGILLFD